MHSGIKHVADQVCQKRQVKLQDVLGGVRTQAISRARAEIICLARDLTGISVSEICRELGGLDPSTGHSAIKGVENRMRNRLGYAAEMQQLRDVLLTPPAPTPQSVMEILDLDKIDAFEIADRITLPSGLAATVTVDEVRAMARMLMKVQPYVPDYVMRPSFQPETKGASHG